MYATVTSNATYLRSFVCSRSSERVNEDDEEDVFFLLVTGLLVTGTSYDVFSSNSCLWFRTPSLTKYHTQQIFCGLIKRALDETTMQEVFEYALSYSLPIRRCSYYDTVYYCNILHSV